MTTDRQRELATRSLAETESGNDEMGTMLAQLAGPDAMEEIIGEDDTDIAQALAPGRRVGQFASEIETLAQEWVWHNWIPTGLVGMFAADSGTGKSSVLRAIARSVTRGEKLPDGQETLPMGVIWVGYEEPTKTKLVPALEAAGCDLAKIKIMTEITPDVRKLGDSAKRMIRFPEDLGYLRAAIEDDEFNCGLVIIDPVLSMSDKALGHNQTVRRLLMQFQQLAQDTSVAIVLVAHLIKGKSPEIRNRMNGSKAFYDFPRYVMAAALDESNPNRAALFMDKTSLCAKPASLTYTRDSMGRVKFVEGLVEEARADYEQEQELRTDQLICAYLRAHAPNEYQARQIAFGIHITYDAARRQLARLTQAGRIERTSRGLYTAKSAQSVPNEKAPQADAAGTKTLSQTVPNADEQTLVLAPTNGHKPINPDAETVLLDVLP